MLTETLEPMQPTRLVWKVKNRVAIQAVIRGLRCVWPDTERPGKWFWMYEYEAASLALGKRPGEIAEGECPIVLGRISSPSSHELVMRFCSPDRAISAAHFFAPRFGRYAVPDRVRILNRLVTNSEAEAGADRMDGLLDRNVTIVDPAERLRKLDALLDRAATRAERLAIYERNMVEERGRDVPEVEDYPLARDGEEGEFIHLANSLQLRMVRAVERWFGKPTTISGVIYRIFGRDPSDPISQARPN
jgi:hypothetical protein